MSEKELSVKEIVEQIDTLPELGQEAMHWLIKNIHIARELSKGEKVPESMIDEWRQLAIERNDPALFALAIYKKVWDDQNTGK